MLISITSAMLLVVPSEAIADVSVILYAVNGTGIVIKSAYNNYNIVCKPVDVVTALGVFVVDVNCTCTVVLPSIIVVDTSLVTCTEDDMISAQLSLNC